MNRALWWVILLLGFFPAPSWAATYWVSPSASGQNCVNSGSDPGDGNSSQTINQGIDCLNGGDTLMIKGGTYVESVVNAIPSGGDDNSRTIIRGSGSSTVIRFPGEYGLLIGANARYITVENLVVDGSGGGSWGAIGLGDHDDTHHIRIRNVETRDIRFGTCIFFGPATVDQATFFELINLNVHNCGWDCYDKVSSLCHGGYLGGSSNTIEGGQWHHNPWGHGIQIYGGGLGGHNNIVRGVAFHHNWTQGLGIYPGNGNQVYNNLMYRNGLAPTGGSGLFMASQNNSLVANNTFYGNSNEAMNCSGSGGGLSFINNITYNTGPSYVNCAPSESSTLTQDPGFVSITDGSEDFRIAQANSPAVNAGVNLFVYFSTDLEGNPRNVGGGWGLGAYKFTEQGPITQLGMVSELRCDGNFADSENGFTFTQTGGVLSNGLRIVGTTGNSCLFDGVDAHLTGPNDAAFRPANVTLGTWIRPTTLPPAGTVFRLMEIGTAAAIGYDPDGRLFAFVNNGPTVIGSTSIVNGVPHLVAMSYDQATGMLRVWDNNANIDSLNIGAGTPLLYGGGDTLVIGGSGGATPGWSNVPMDNIRIRDDAITPGMMQQWYLENPLPQPGLVSSHWRFYQADAAENTLIPGQAVDAPSIVVNRSSKVRQRWNVKRNGSTITAFFQAECNLNGGAFATIDNSCVTNPVCVATDSVKNMGDATADLDLPNDGFTFVPGRFVVDTINTAFTTQLADAQETEWETGYAFKSTLADQDVITCRLRIPSGVLDTYPATLPQIIMSVPPGSSLLSGTFQGVTVQ